MEKYSSPLSYLWAGATTAIGILTLEQWVAVVGIVCTIGTFLINVYYRKKEYKLKEHHYEDTEKNIDGNRR
nr:phage holin family protein [Arsenophonus endosymbiont of Apis mellifera]